MRLVHKKELGCQATAPVVIKEEVRENPSSTKIETFWQLLGGKKGVKCKCHKRVNFCFIFTLLDKHFRTGSVGLNSNFNSLLTEFSV